MLLECLIEREGGTPVQVGQTRLYFCPRPELTQGDTQSNVCEVNMKEIWEYLLSTPQGNFVKYEKGSTYNGRKKAKTWENVQPVVKPTAPQEEDDQAKDLVESSGHDRFLKLEEENLDLKAELAVADKLALEILTSAIEGLEPPEGWQPADTVSGKIYQISNLIADLRTEIAELKVANAIRVTKPVKSTRKPKSK